MLRNVLEHRILPALKFNTLGFAKNKSWSDYLSVCQDSWSKGSNQSDSSEVSRVVKEMKRDGLAVIDRIDVSSLAAKISTNFLEQIKKSGLKEFPASLALSQELQVEFCDSIHEKLLLVSPVIEKFFQSYFQPYWIAIYRTQPGAVDAGGSFDWHMDNNPKEYMKIFFYLNDVKESNGAFRAVKRKGSRYLIMRGFRSNSESLRIKNGPMVDRFVSKFPTKLKVLEGDAGTVIFFDNNLVHKGTLPEQGTRTVVSIAMIPSLNPFTKSDVRSALESPRTRDYPENPAHNDFGGLI